MTDIFIAYSHEDLAFKNELRKFLRPLLRENRISVWDDYDIEAGQDWDAAIKERLYSAGIVLLLVSADSLASDYFYGKEVEVSLARHARGEAVVVPVVLRHCDWKNTPLGNLEAVPEKGRPVVEWHTRDEAWQNVVERLHGVLDAIEERRKKENEAADQYRRYTAAVTAAEQFAHRENWQEARVAYADALDLHLPGFMPDKADIKGRVAECERHIRDEKARQRAGTPDDTRRYTFNNRYLWFGGGALVLALLLWLVFGGPAAQGPPLETDLYNKAIETGTIPALRNYLDQYPASSNAAAARQKLGALQKIFDQNVQSARSFETAEEWQDALELYGKALSIQPDAHGLKSKVEELKRK